MNELLYNFLEPISSLLPLLVLLFYIKKAKASKELLLLFSLYGGLFTLYLTSSFFAYFDIPNNFLYNIVILFSFTLLSIYFCLIMKSRRVKIAIAAIIMPVFISLFCIYTFFLKKDTLFNSVGYTVMSIVIIIYSFLFIWEKFSLLEFENIYDDYRFWVIASFMLYYISSFFIFLSYHYLTSKGLKSLSQEQIKNIGVLWGLHNIFYFISCLTVSYGLKWKGFRAKYLL
jgi:hypothetical protein